MEYVPPHDMNLETALLSSIIVDNTALPDVSEILIPDHFYKTAHRLIYKSILNLYQKNQPVEFNTIKDELESMGRLDQAGGISYVTDMTDTEFFSGNATDYAKRIHALSIRRSLMVAANKVFNDAKDRTVDVEDLVESTQKRILDINTYSDPEYSWTDDLVMDAIDRYEEIHKKKILVTGVPTGFDHLDKVLSGMQPSDLIILAGRPSMGKTAFALQVAKGSADNGYKPFMFSLEQPKEQLMDRMFASETRLPTTVFRSGYWSNDDWVKITEGAAKIHGVRIGFDDRGGQHYREMCKTARLVVKRHGVNCIIIDHLQLVAGAGHKGRNDEVGIYTRKFKALAKELKVPVLLLSQLSREVEKRGNKRPQLSDLRDSGNIEQDADVVMFLYRDEVYHQEENNPNKGKAELIVAKQRQGPICTLHFVWLAKMTRFEPAFEGGECDY